MPLTRCCAHEDGGAVGVDVGDRSIGGKVKPRRARVQNCCVGASQDFLQVPVVDLASPLGGDLVCAGRRGVWWDGRKGGATTSRRVSIVNNTYRHINRWITTSRPPPSGQGRPPIPGAPRRICWDLKASVIYMIIPPTDATRARASWSAPAALVATTASAATSTASAATTAAATAASRVGRGVVPGGIRFGGNR